MPSLTLAYIAKSHVNATFMTCFMEALPQLKQMTPYEIRANRLIGKSNLPHARSIMLSNWYLRAEQGDLFMFIDTDQTFSAYDIVKVIGQTSDLRAGIYGNRANKPTSLSSTPLNLPTNNPLEFAATGFLCITYYAAQKIHEYMKNQEGVDTVIISDNHPIEGSVIPFFQPVFAELKPGKVYWLGEDFSFSYRAKQAGLTIMGAVTGTIGHEIPIIVNYKCENSDRPKIVYFCGPSAVQFSPTIQNLGGSEQAVVYLSQALYKLGYDITVYGNVFPGDYGGVFYRNFREFDPDQSDAIVILWRRYGLMVLPQLIAKQIIIDLHDPTDPKFLHPQLIKEKKATICVKSNYHRSLYPHHPDEQFKIIPNGLQIERLNSISINRPRKSNKFCYTSSYDRGLVPILKYMWPHIRESIPDATLEIHYGNNLLPEPVKRELEPLLKQAGVTDYGRSNYENVVRVRQESLAQLYVSPSPLEIDCLSIREAAYVGCIPIISNHAVFPERSGIHVNGDANSESTQLEGAKQAVALYHLSDDKREIIMKTMKESPLNLNWDDIAQHWIKLFAR